MDYEFALGLDECGRGSIAGPISVGCTLIELGSDSYWWDLGAKDSKKLTAPKRERLYRNCIYEDHPFTFAFQIAYRPAIDIDNLGIAKATQLCVWDCLNSMFEYYQDQIKYIYFDRGLKPRKIEEHVPEHMTVIEADKDGESKWASVALASVLAKVDRDLHMQQLGKQFQKYGFENNKGYESKVHEYAIRKYGLLPNIHRYSFCKKFIKPD